MADSKKPLREVLKHHQNPKAGMIIEFVDSSGLIQSGQLMSKALVKANTREKGDTVGEVLMFNIRIGHSRQSIDLSPAGNFGWKWITYQYHDKKHPSLQEILNQYPDDEGDEDGNVSLVCIPGSVEHMITEATGSDHETDNKLVELSCLKKPKQTRGVVREKELQALELALNLYHDNIVFAHRDHINGHILTSKRRSEYLADRSRLMEEINRLRAGISEELDKSQDSREIAEMVLNDIEAAANILFRAVRGREEELMLVDPSADLDASLVSSASALEDSSRSTILEGPRNSTMAIAEVATTIEPEKEKPKRFSLWEDSAIIEPERERSRDASSREVEDEQGNEDSGMDLTQARGDRLITTRSVLIATDDDLIECRNECRRKDKIIHEQQVKMDTMRQTINDWEMSYEHLRSDYDSFQETTITKCQEHTNELENKDATIAALSADLNAALNDISLANFQLDDARLIHQQKYDNLQARYDNVVRDHEELQRTLKVDGELNSRALIDTRMEMKRMEAEMGMTQNHIMELKNELKDAQRAKSEIRDLLMEREGEISTLKEKLGLLEGREQEVIQLREQIQLLQVDIHEVSESHLDLQQYEHRAKIAERSVKLSEAREQNLQLSLDKELENKALQEGIIANLKSQIDDLNVNIGILKNREEDLLAHGNPSVIARDNAKLKGDLSLLQAKYDEERAAFVQRAGSSDARITLLKSTKEELELENETLKRNIADLKRKADHVSKEANKRFKDQEDEIINLRQSLSEIRSSATRRPNVNPIDGSDHNHEDPTELEQIRNKKISDLESEVKARSVRILALEARIKELGGQLDTSKQHLAAIDREHTKLLNNEMSENVKLQSRITQLEGQMATDQTMTENRTVELEKELDSLQSIRAAELQMYKQLQDSNLDLLKEKESLKSIIAAKNKELEDARHVHFSESTPIPNPHTPQREANAANSKGSASILSSGRSPASGNTTASDALPASELQLNYLENIEKHLHTLQNRPTESALDKSSKMSSNIRQILYRARAARGHWQDLVKTEAEVNNLSLETIRKLLSSTSETEFKKAMEEFRDIDMKIEIIVIESEVSPTKMSTTDSENLSKERTECAKMRSKLKETQELLQTSAQKRNIKLSTTDNRDKGINTRREEPHFNGDGASMHIYEFLSIVKDYLKVRSIPTEEAGEIVKSFISGPPRTLVNARFTHQVNPNYNDLCTLLKKEYGNRKTILKQIWKQHEAIGKIAEFNQYLQVSETDLHKTYERVEKHMILFEKVRLLQGEEYGNDGNGTLDIPDYRYIILKILPHDESKIFMQHTKGTSDDITMDIIRRTLQGIRDIVSEFIKESLAGLKKDEDIHDSSKASKPDTKKKGNQASTYLTQGNQQPVRGNNNNTNDGGARSKYQEITKKNVNIKDCKLCNHMDNKFGIRLDNHEHGVVQGKNGDLPLIDSCPHIIGLNIRDKHDFLMTHGVCRSCMLEAVDLNHNEKKCAEQMRESARCKEPTCKIKYLVCPHHLHLQTVRLQTKKAALNKVGLNYNFIAFAKARDEVIPERIPSLRAMANHKGLNKYKTEDELIQAICHEKGGTLINEFDGPPIFIYCHVQGPNGKQALISFDSCSTYTLFNKRAVGGTIPSMFTEVEGRDIVTGIGGDQETENCTALIPLINNRYYRLSAQVIPDILHNRYSHLRQETVLLKQEAIDNNISLHGEIDYPAWHEELQALIGIKNSELMPTLVFSTSVGLNIYETEIYTGMNGNKTTFCMGGCLGLLNKYERLHGKRFMEEALSLVSRGTSERIPEIKLSSEEIYKMTYKEVNKKTTFVKRFVDEAYDTEDDDEAELQESRRNRDLSWTQNEDKCQNVLSFLAHSHLGHPSLAKRMTKHEQDNLWSYMTDETQLEQPIKQNPVESNPTTETSADFRGDIMSFLAHSFLGHPKPTKGTAYYEQDIPLSHFSEKSLSKESVTPSFAANIPMDEARFDFINNVLKSSFKLTNSEIEQMLVGPSAERMYRCARCSGCRDCEKEPKNEAVSISKLKEDQKFKNMVRIDEPTKLIICKLPLPEGYRDLLANNKPTAARRLQREFIKLSKLEKSKAQVAKTWKKYRDNGFIKLRDEMNAEQQKALDAEQMRHFLSCSIAYKVDSISTAARICVDPSSPAGPGGASLNSILPRGDVVLNLPGNVQRFLTYPHQEIADVKCFYNSFHLDPSQIHVHGFLWDEALNPNNTPREYFMTVLFFGIICISKLCQIALELVAKRHPRIEDTVTRDMYVDDLGVRGFSKETTKKLRSDVIEDFGIYSLRFKGWGANLETPDEAVADDGWMSYLGLKWKPETDIMTIKIPRIFKGSKKKGQTEQLLFWEGKEPTELYEFIDKSMTFRELLGRIMAFFDSSGLLSPLLSSLRHLIREASRIAGREYDTSLPTELTQNFCEVAASFEKFRDWEYKRNNHVKKLEKEEFEIVVFSDAGSIAKQTVMYTRAKTISNDYSVSFLAARNALCKPIQNIPKSELDSLYQASVYCAAAKKNLDPHVTRCVAFTDSMIAIHWLLNPTHSLQLFHRTRAAHILNTFTSDDGEIDIYWIASHANIADIGTKGKCKAEDLGPTSPFANGPAFLRSDLKEAEDRGIIMKITSIKSQLLAEEKKLMNDGLLIKRSPWLEDASGISNDKDDETSTTLLATETTDQLQVLYKHGGYIMDPLKIDFSKVVTIHMLVFKFLKRIIKPCSVHSTSTKFTEILDKWKDSTTKQTAFALTSQTTNPIQQLEFATTSRNLNRMLSTNSKKGINHEMITNINAVMSEIERQAEESPNHLDIPTARLHYTINQVGYEYSKIEGKGEALREATSFMSNGQPAAMDRYAKELRSWKIYPGCNKALDYIAQAEHITGSWVDKPPRDDKTTMLACAMILNVHCYIKKYMKYAYPGPLMMVLKYHLTKVTASIPEESWKFFSNLFTRCQESPIEVLRDWNEPAFYEAVQWVCSDSFTPKMDELTIQSAPTRLGFMKPRNLVAETLKTQAEFANLQLLTYSYFHTIFTKEIRATWSPTKIKAHCIEREGKLISSWRLRAGAELADILTKELQEGMATCANIYPTWPSLLPVADKNSPLLISMALHFHYRGSINPLQRSRLLFHRGIHMNQAQLLQMVVAPGVLETLTRIRDGCALCRVRLNKHYQAMFGSLPPTAHISNQGFLSVQIDQMGPFKVKVLQTSRETRYQKHTKMYVMAIVCMLTKAVHLELMEDMSAESVASALSRLSCQQQAPAIVFCDQHKSNISVMEKAELHTQVNDILVRQHGFRYELCPVGKHFSHGLVESKIKSVGRLLGKLDMERSPMSIIGFQTILLMIQELINSVPLGVTLSNKDPCLKVVTPAKLIGKVNGRRLMRPISVPVDASNILKENEERWKAVSQLFSSAVLPAMLKNYKWHQDSGDALHEEAVVMFKKKTGYNFVNEWSLGKVIEVYPGSDSKIRSAKIEYIGAQDSNDLLEMHGNKKEPPAKHTTVRDANELIMLFPISSGFNIELKQLHYEMLQIESKQIQQDLCAHYVRNKHKSLMGAIKPATCIHGTQDKYQCKTCQLLELASQEAVGTIEISCKDAIYLKGEFRYDPEVKIMHQLAKLLTSRNISSKQEVEPCRLLSSQGQPYVEYSSQHVYRLELSKCAQVLVSLVGGGFTETDRQELPAVDTTTDQIVMKVMDANSTTLIVPMDIIKREIDKRKLAKRNKRNRRLQNYGKLISEEFDRRDADNLEKGIFKKKIHWEDPLPPRRSDEAKLGGCTSSCCCWQHCSISHLPELLTM